MENQLSWKILKTLALNGKASFSYQDVMDTFPDVDRIYISKVLSQMVKIGMLIKLKQSMYHIVPLSADSENYIPDWHLVAKYLMQDQPYYIGYYSAMQIHGLITQPSLKEIIVTPSRLNYSSRIIQGVEFQFVYHIAKRFFGAKNTWINDYEKVMVSDLEKTIVDAVSKPHLCGGIVEVGRAIFESRNSIDLEKLQGYFTLYESHAATKRYLFVYDLFGLPWTSIHEHLLQHTGNSYSLLDTSAPKTGSKDGKFGLKINVDLETIKQGVFT